MTVDDVRAARVACDAIVAEAERRAEGLPPDPVFDVPLSVALDLFDTLQPSREPA